MESVILALGLSIKPIFQLDLFKYKKRERLRHQADSVESVNDFLMGKMESKVSQI